MRTVTFFLLALAIGFPTFAGCAEINRVTASSWHEKCGWKAEDYFDVPQVIALCKAIENNNLKEIDRLIAAGANVNATGKGNMTPLLWAYPDNKLDRFKKLLEHGADPNVIIASDFNTRGGMSAGDSVTHMACKTEFPGYFEAVFEHGGDVNLINPGKSKFKDSPLHLTIKYGGNDKKRRIQFLIHKGADINYMNGTWTTPVMQATSWGGGRFDIALMLLEVGADYRFYPPKSNGRLIHLVIGQERLSEEWTPQQRVNYRKLVKWLEDHGESVEEAKADLARWQSWNHATGEYRRNMDAEIAERKAREARENAADNEPHQETGSR